jgi:hypothetical protein
MTGEYPINQFANPNPVYKSVIYVTTGVGSGIGLIDYWNEDLFYRMTEKWVYPPPFIFDTIVVMVECLIWART